MCKLVLVPWRRTLTVPTVPTVHACVRACVRACLLVGEMLDEEPYNEWKVISLVVRGQQHRVLWLVHIPVRCPRLLRACLGHDAVWANAPLLRWDKWHTTPIRVQQHVSAGRAPLGSIRVRYVVTARRHGASNRVGSRETVWCAHMEQHYRGLG